MTSPPVEIHLCSDCGSPLRKVRWDTGICHPCAKERWKSMQPPPAPKPKAERLKRAGRPGDDTTRRDYEAIRAASADPYTLHKKYPPHGGKK